VKLPKSIAEWWPLALLIGLLTSMSWFGGQIAHAAAEPFWKYIAPAIPQTLLLSLCCLQLLVIILLVGWLIYLNRVQREPTEAEKKKAFDDQFGDFVPDRGVWTHKTKPGYFCPNCKAWLRESRMQELPNGRGWRCLVHDCEHLSKNPDYKEPRATPGTQGKGWKVY
jgi:hypothetical protein